MDGEGVIDVSAIFDGVQGIVNRGRHAKIFGRAKAAAKVTL